MTLSAELAVADVLLTLNEVAEQRITDPADVKQIACDARGEIDRLRTLNKSLVDALIRVAGQAPSSEPQLDDMGGQKDDVNFGYDSALWDIAKTAKRALST